jgi:hypothetical protein
MIQQLMTLLGCNRTCKSKHAINYQKEGEEGVEQKMTNSVF